MTVRTTRPEEFEDQIIFMSTLNDVGSTKNWKLQGMFFGFWNGKKLRKEISVWTWWSFLGPGEENMVWNEKLQTWRTMEFNCRASGALDRGFCRKKSGRCTIHFSAEPSNGELLSRTINSATQLSIYGAVADWCDHLAQQILGQKLRHAESVGWIRWFTKIGPVIQVRATGYLDQDGIEVQVPSMLRNGMKPIKNKKSLRVTLRWWVLQALSNHTQ